MLNLQANRPSVAANEIAPLRHNSMAAATPVSQATVDCGKSALPALQQLGVDQLQAHFGINLSAAEPTAGEAAGKLAHNLAHVLENLAKQLKQPELFAHPNEMQTSAGHMPLEDVLKAGHITSKLTQLLEDHPTPLDQAKTILKTPVAEVSKLEDKQKAFYTEVFKAVHEALKAHSAQESPTVQNGLKTVEAAQKAITQEPAKAAA